MTHPPLAILGGGNMARAIYGGGLASGRLEPDAVVVAEPLEERRGGFAHAVASAGEALDWLERREAAPGEGCLLLAVKPQNLGDLASEIAARVGERPVVSILAGTPSPRICEALGGRARIVRVMPNTPAQVGRGMSAVARGAGASEADAAMAAELFEGVGRVVRIDESQMDAFTALAGSGPAYVFLLAEAMAAAARELGLGEAEAALAAQETIAGAALLMASGDATPEELRRRVTSPGGTTQAALEVFEKGDLRGLVARAMAAARDRGRELAGA